jgi:(S)-2-hydroxyglutarate dehydrogenase
VVSGPGTRTADVGIVGGGIVGLAMAHALLARHPGLDVVVLDKEPHLGAHASGRNSGVLHAGFYYAPDSLKAALTRRGNQLLHEFCDAHGVTVRRCGKVVVTTSEDELPALRQLHARGRANGVDVQVIRPDELRELEPLASTVGEALWSPTTSVADPLEVIEALAAQVRAAGARVELGSPVEAGGVGWLTVAGQRWSVGHVVNSAGLHADVVGGWFGFCDDYVVLPFKGLYWYGSWPPGRLRRHVYPVPDARNPFLGVHLTVTAAGGVKVGPTAIPALWREDYGGLSNARPWEVRSALRRYPAFLTSPHHDVPALIRTEVPKYLRRQLVRQARALVPSLDPDDFRIRGRPGVRAQMWSIPQRRLEMDFVVRGDRDSTHLLNVVSPGWTSALAVADHVVTSMAASGAL